MVVAGFDSWRGTTMTDFLIPETRSACPLCYGRTAYITETGAQDVVRCIQCDAFLYNAPRHETGKAVRPVSDGRSTIKPAVRWRVLERFNHSCVGCGATDVILHIDHIIPLAAAAEYDFIDLELLEDEVNLTALCEVCNLGKSDSFPSIRLMYRCLQVHQAGRK